MFPETGEVSADDRARVSNPKSEAFYEHDAILVSLPAQAEPIDDRRNRRRLATSAQQAALDAASHRDKAREKIWNDDAPPNLPPQVT